MDAEINNVIYMELNSGPKIANSTWGKTIIAGTIDRDSTVATGYGLDGPGIKSRWGARFSAPVQTSSEAHPASYTMGTGSFPGVWQPGAWR